MKFSELFKKPAVKPTTMPMQTARSFGHPFGILDRYVPLSRGEFMLYDSIREAVPVVDAAIGKIIALVGGVTVECSDPTVQTAMNHFLTHVPVGTNLHGMDAFIGQHLEQLLMYGTSVGEILPTYTGDGIGALHNVPLTNLEIEQDFTHGKGIICVREGGKVTPAPYQELLLLTALNPKPGEAWGNSLLKGLPFVTDILLKIYNTVGLNFERVGNVRFAVTYKPTKEATDRGLAKERAMQMAEEWKKAMEKNHDGRVSDFIAVGDVDIKVIGADNQILDSNIPVRQMLEQIVAKTGIPPFMLGLSWSSTERMSSQQADMLTSELWAYRRQLTPIVEKICDWWLRLKGIPCEFTVHWDEISLQDEVAMANAAYTRVQTQLLEQQLKGDE